MGLNTKEFYMNQIESCKRTIKQETELIEQSNRMLKMYRKEDKDFVEYIWSKGVVDSWDYEHYCTGKYKSNDTKQEEKFRSHCYKWRKDEEKRLAYYTNKLEAM